MISSPGGRCDHGHPVRRGIPVVAASTTHEPRPIGGRAHLPGRADRSDRRADPATEPRAVLVPAAALGTVVLDDGAQVEWGEPVAAVVGWLGVTGVFVAITWLNERVIVDHLRKERSRVESLYQER